MLVLAATGTNAGILGVVAFILAVLGMGRPPLIGDRLWRFACWTAAGEVALAALHPKWWLWVLLGCVWPLLLGTAFLIERRRDQQSVPIASTRTGILTEGKGKTAVEKATIRGQERGIHTKDDAETEIGDVDIS